MELHPGKLLVGLILYFQPLRLLAAGVLARASGLAIKEQGQMVGLAAVAAAMAAG